MPKWTSICSRAEKWLPANSSLLKTTTLKRLHSAQNKLCWAVRVNNGYTSGGVPTNTLHIGRCGAPRVLHSLNPATYNKFALPTLLGTNSCGPGIPKLSCSDELHHLQPQGCNSHLQEM